MKSNTIQCLVLLAMIGASATRGENILFTVPEGFYFSEGNDGSRLPFAYLGPVRYQQVFDASDFGTLPPGGAYLTRIFLQVNCPSCNCGWLVTNLQVTVSTTSKAPDGLSPIFSENVGSDETIVFGPRNYNPPGGGSCATFLHGQEINVDTPFFYNPALGNLLIETRHENISWQFQPMNPNNDFTKWLLDAETVVGDSVSRIAAFSLTTNMAEVVETTGLVVLFQFDPIPSLTNSVSSNEVVVTWPALPDTFSLQWAPRVGTNASWQLYTNPIVEGGLYNMISIPKQELAASMYFRLAWEDAPPIPQSGGSTNGPPP